MNDLPIEILELIIDHVAASLEIKHLLSCSLVCKTWLPLCQQRIFAQSTVLSGKDSKAHLEGGLVYALTNNPSLSQYIKALKIYFRPDESASDTPNISHFLHLPRLETLVLYPTSGGPISYNHPITPRNSCEFKVRSIHLIGPRRAPLYHTCLATLAPSSASVQVVGQPPSTTALEYFRAQHVDNLALSVFAPGTQLESLSLDAQVLTVMDHNDLVGAEECDLAEVFPNLKHFFLNAFVAGVFPDHQHLMSKILGMVPPVERLTFQGK
ncbi:hypothetical protein CVT24_012018 [Panaeolus cyanescens]|uniref:F-box domain-containing protein n=1 Tax=Panaeolus cyanescens TaxID=181874 RepID=A0A409YNH7_9AGAR|nr:hypothetical protein CVT24_012018 [Panaeolus cyanescens]